MKTIDSSYDLLPGCLRRRLQWLPWSLRQNNGRLSKIPIDPATDRWAKWSDPNVLVSFRHATEYCRCFQLHGIGFFFLDSDPYVGIDLDSCRDDRGRVREWARRIVDEFGSYCEISPSGTGLKIIIHATKPDWADCKVANRFLTRYKPASDKKAIEIALTASCGYFALTGRVYRHGCVRCCQRKFEAFCNRYWQPSAEPNKRNTTKATNPPPCAFKNGQHITPLQRAELRRRLARADRAGPNDGTGGQSRHDFSLMCWLLRKEIDPESLWPVFAKHSKFKRQGRSYFDTTVANARIAVDNKTGADRYNAV